MIAFTGLPIMFPQCGATEVNAEHEAMKGGVSVNRRTNLFPRCESYSIQTKENYQCQLNRIKR